MLTPPRMTVLFASFALVWLACAEPEGTVAAADEAPFDPSTTVDVTQPDSPGPPIWDFPDPAELPERPELPDPLVMFRTSEPVETADDWLLRRHPEIRALSEHYVYGKAPTSFEPIEATLVEEASDALGGLARRRQVDIRLGAAGAPVLHLLLYLPAGAVEPPPVFLGLNFYGNHTVSDDPAVPLSAAWVPERGEGVVDNRATEAARGTSADRWSIVDSLQRGYAVATAYHGDIDPDDDDSSNGIQARYYVAGQTEPGLAEWGTIAAWAWGLSRVMERVPRSPGR